MANVFQKASEYRKKHPRTSFQDAIQKVKGKTVSGVKKKTVKVAGVKPKKAAPKVAAKTVNVRVGKIGSLAKGEKLVKEINRLEALRKKVTGREMRDLYQLQINAHHKSLNALKRSF